MHPPDEKLCPDELGRPSPSDELERKVQQAAEDAEADVWEEAMTTAPLDPAPRPLRRPLRHRLSKAEKKRRKRQRRRTR